MNSPRILVVDDDEHNLLFFREILRRKEYNVDDANSGESALEKIASGQYDLIISDLNMYRVDGLDVLDAAKKKDRFTQVLILTGFGSVATAVEAMKQGAYEYLSKPIDQEAFLIKVKNAIEHRRMLKLVEEQQNKIDEYHKLIGRDLELAKRVNESLVPKNYRNRHCVVAVEYLPMLGIGGDFVDIYDNQAGRLYLTAIDITGHGITAALMVNRLCSEIHKLVRDDLHPREILHHLNRFFYDSFAQTGLFLTIMSVMIDYQAGFLIHAGSAHPAGLLYCSGTQSIKRLIPQNIIIGFDNIPLEQFKQDQYELQSGDRIIMFTDGLIEAENQEQISFGSASLKSCLQKYMHEPAPVIAQNVIREISEFNHGELSDDILLIVTDFQI